MGSKPLLSRKNAAVALLVAIGCAGVASSLMTSTLRFAGVALAVACFFVAGTMLSAASAMAVQARSLVDESVRVEVWGRPLQISPNEPNAVVESVKVFGAALLIRLGPAVGGRHKLLKIAQPKHLTVLEGRVEIREARYVSWAGTKLKRAAGAPAVVFVPQTLPS